MSRYIGGAWWLTISLGLCLLGVLVQFSVLPEWCGPASKAYWLGGVLLVAYVFRRLAGLPVCPPHS